MNEDTEYTFHYLDVSTQEKDIFLLLKVIFDNYEELREHFDILNKDDIKQL